MATQQEAIKIFGESLEEANLIKGTSNNDVLAVFSDNVLVNSGGGNDTIEVYGAQNVTIETGEGKDEIYFPFEGYDNPSVTFTDFDPQNDILNFPEWAFFYEIYHFRASVKNGNLILQDGAGWYTLTFNGVTSTDTIKNIRVKKWDGYSTTLGNILYNTISSSDPDKIIDFEIPNDALYYNGQSYYIYANVASTWEEAQSYCQSLGGHLAVINDSAENTALFNYMKSKGYNSAYFGLSDAATEGTWQWVDGSSVTYTNWASGEPNGSRSENYGMFYKGFNNSKWNDGDFSYDVKQHTANFICEWTPIQSTEIADDAFEYNGHSYYLYSGVATTWEEAQAYCQSLGGHLAVINDSAENTTLFNYMKSKGYNSAYFGLSDAVTEGTWQWVDGSSVTYTNWASGEPNSERINEDYAEFYYKFTDGKWNDGNFNQGTVGDSNVFICEWDTLKSSGTDTKVSNIGTAIIDALKSMNNDEFKDFINKIKNVANGITKAGDMEIPSLGSKPFKISGIIGDTIEYLQSLQHLIFHSSETGLSASANIEKLASSSIKEFASIYDLLNEFSSATDTSIWGATAEKNIQVLTLASDLLSVRASITAVNANYEEEGIKAAILSCGEVFKNLGKTANDLYKSKITNPTKKGPWNAVDFYAALMNSAWGIFEQSYKSHQKYYADGKWNLEDTARLLMDVSISGLYGITHTLFEENDDLLWDLFLGDSYEDSGMTYPERLSAKLADISGAIGDAIGRFGLNVTTGLQDLWNQLKSFQYGVGVGLGVVFRVGSIISKVLLGSKSVTYLAENGEVLSSSKNAIASITMDKGKATFKTLKNVKQNLSLGSQKDTMEWTINTKDSNDDIIISSIKNTTVNSGGGNDTIFIKGTGDAYVDAGNGNDIIDGSTGNDILKGGKGNDIISGGSGNDTLTGGSGNDTFVYESGNDVIEDYFTGENTIKLITGSVINASLKNSDVILKTSMDSITVKKGKGKKITVIDGNGNITTEYYGMLNYSSDKKTVTLNSAFSASLKAEDYATTVTKIDASAVAKSISIVGNAQNNTILGSNKAETIYGGSGNDSILGNAGNDKLYGDSGADSLNGGKGNDTLTGGTGKDIFLYASGEGNDVIADFTVGQDKIKITSGKISSASLKSSDIVFKIGNGTLTVKNGKNKELAIGNAIYYNNLTYDTNKTAVTLGSGFSGSLKSTDYATTAKTINASSVTKSINIIGNSQDNTIIGSAKAETIYGGTGNDSIVGNAGNDKLYGDAGNDKLFGGEGNDTLNGGAGNDTLTGGNGKDVFAYEGGNDVITDYSAGQDTIKINNGKITKTSYSGNSVVFSVGSGSITVQNGKGKKIAITDSNNKTTTQIYNQDVSYVSAKTSSNARWFTEDDNNFITDDIQISEITQETESNYVTEQTEIFKKANEFDVTDSIVSTVNLVKK